MPMMGQNLRMLWLVHGLSSLISHRLIPGKKHVPSRNRTWDIGQIHHNPPQSTILEHVQTKLGDPFASFRAGFRARLCGDLCGRADVPNI